MKHEYFQPKTKAYFAVRSISEFRNEIISDSLHQWFTILICSTPTGELAIDDSKLTITKPQAVFITPGQHIHIPGSDILDGYAISFNQEFYCIEYHDNDVSCQGLLFVNNFNMVHFDLDEQQLAIYNNTAKEIIAEMEGQASLQDEMLKNLLKNLLIRSNRLFRNQMSFGDVDDSSIDFVRKFSDLVEKYFREIKQVEMYSDMMNIASASLTKKLQKYGIDSPSKIIKARVVTEAKRLLIYTDKSVKEISVIIGYDDPFYFSRIFTKEAGISPSEYKKIHART
jgi:AraC-like DNA-binding protein